MSPHERERLSAYLDHELPPAERASVESHVTACPECAALLADLAAVDEAAATLPAEAPAGYFEAFPARVLSRLEARKAASAGRRLPAWTWAAAAALLLAVVTPLTLRQLRPSSGAALSPLASRPAPAKAEPTEAEEGRRPTPVPAAPRARDARLAAPPVPEAKPRGSKDEAVAEGRFAGEPGAPPPAPRERAAAPATTRADAESAPEAGGAAPEAAATREKSLRDQPRAAATGARAEAGASALSAADAAPAGAAPDVQERQDAFRRLDAARPRSAVEWRRLRDEWDAFASVQADPFRADEARVRAVVAGREAWLAGGDESDETTFRRDAAAYLRRGDALQKLRVERLLAEPRRTP